MYTECVYTVPIAISHIFYNCFLLQLVIQQRELNVCTPFPFIRTIFSIIFCFLLQLIVIQQRERCIQNVCTPFPLLYHHIFYNFRFLLQLIVIQQRERCIQNCVHRSHCYIRTIFSIIFCFLLQLIVIQQCERCIQNVCTPFPLLYQNHIFYNFHILFFTPIDCDTTT